MKGLVCLAILLLAATSTLAHDLALSGIRFIERRADTVISVEVHKSVIGSGNVDEAVRGRLHLTLNGAAFTPGASTIIADRGNDIVDWQVTAPKGKFEVGERLFPENREARTIVTFIANGSVVGETILDSSHPSTVASLTSGSGQIAVRFLRLGVEHIVSGADHILFVLGLILLGGSFKSLFKTVTAFTVAHSITLTLTALQLIHPSSRVVEPLIALSIVAIAFENLRPKAKGKARDYRPYLAFAFGLIHGFGFAGALADVGLPAQALPLALATFNIGVELGQAVIILAALPIIGWIGRQKPESWARISWGGSIGIASIGAFWFLQRIMSGGS